MEMFISIMNAAFRLTTPIAYVTLGAVVLEKSGINALAMEGIMLIGAFGAAVGSWGSGSAWIGLLTGILCGVAVSMIRSWLCISHQANQTVSGVGINILVGGVTAMLLKIIWGMDGKSETVTALKDWSLPLIKNIPVIGDFLGKQNPLAYLLIPVLIMIWILINRTPFGLRLITAGEHPDVLSSLGLKVSTYRYLASVIAGVLAGIGGAYLSIGQLSFFNQDMTSGRGYMALAACVFGRWTVGGAFCGAVLFGVAEAIQIRLQTQVQYTQFIQMIPYVVTLIVLSGLVKKNVAAPKASGKSYREQQ